MDKFSSKVHRVHMEFGEGHKNTARVLIVQALQKGPSGANQIAYTDIGSADNLAKQCLELRNTAFKTMPC